MKRTATALIVLGLVAANGLLAYLVWDRMSDAQVDTASTPRSGSTAPAEPSDTEADGRTQLTAGPGVYIVSRRGACTPGGRPSLHRSTDDGATFGEISLPLLDHDPDTPAPQIPTLRTIDHVEAESADEITVIGTDQACATAVYSTTDGGQNWSEAEAGGVWYITPSGLDLIAPDGQAHTPGCTVREIHPRDDLNLRAVCADGRIFGSSDGGAGWVVLGSLDGLQSALFSGLGTALGVAADEECPARAHTTGNAGATWTAAGCISDTSETVTLAGTPEQALALVGETHLLISTDAGLTWQDPAEDGA